MKRRNGEAGPNQIHPFSGYRAARENRVAGQLRPKNSTSSGRNGVTDEDMDGWQDELVREGVPKAVARRLRFIQEAIIEFEERLERLELTAADGVHQQRWLPVSLNGGSTR